MSMTVAQTAPFQAAEPYRVQFDGSNIGDDVLYSIGSLPTGPGTR